MDECNNETLGASRKQRAHGLDKTRKGDFGRRKIGNPRLLPLEGNEAIVADFPQGLHKSRHRQIALAGQAELVAIRKLCVPARQKARIFPMDIPKRPAQVHGRLRRRFSAMAKRMMNVPNRTDARRIAHRFEQTLDLRTARTAVMRLDRNADTRLRANRRIAGELLPHGMQKRALQRRIRRIARKNPHHRSP